MACARISLTDPADRELIGICIGIAVTLTATGIAGPVIPLLLVDLGASPALLGIIIGGSTIVSLFLAVPGGYLTGRIGTRTTVVIGSVTMSLPCFVVAAAPSLGTVFGAMVVIEIGRILVAVAAQAHVANLGHTPGARPRNAGLDFGWYGSAAAVGQMLGPVIGGLLLDGLGAPSAFLGKALLGLASAGAYFLLIGNPREAPGHQSPPEPGSRGPRRAWLAVLNRGALTAILASFAVIFALGARTSFYPIYVRDIGFSAVVIGVLMSARAFVSMGSRLLMGRMIRIMGGTSRTLVASMVILAVGIGTTPLLRSLPLLLANSILVGLGVGIALPLSMATVADEVEPGMRGVAMGVRLTGNRLATLFNPLLFGAVAQGLGIPAAFAIGGVLLAAGAAWVGRANRSRA